MQCQNCGNNLEENQKFCNLCGQKIENILVCSKCGTKLEVGQKFCSKCGQSVQGGQQEKVDKIELQEVHASEKSIGNNKKITSAKYLKLMTGVGIIVIVAILFLNIIGTSMPDEKEIQNVTSSQDSKEQVSKEVDTLDTYLKEAIHVKGEELVNNPNNYQYNKIAITTNVTTTVKAGLAEYTDSLNNFSQEEILYLNSLPVWFSYDEFLGTYLLVYDDRYDKEEMKGGTSFITYGLFLGLNEENMPVILAKYIDNGEATINSSEVRGMVEQDFLNACNLYTSDQIDSDTTLMGMPTYGFGRILYKEFANGMDASAGYSYVVDAGIENQPSFIITTNENFNVDDVLVVWGFIGEQLSGASGRCYLDTYGAVKYEPGKMYSRTGSEHRPLEDTSKNFYDQTTDAYDESGYILPDIASRYFTYDDLDGLSKEQLRLARNEVYARHGRKFETEDLNQYFSSQPWYSGYLSADEFNESVLNEFEKANLEIIKSAEAGKNQSEVINLVGGKYEDLTGNYPGFVIDINVYSDPYKEGDYTTLGSLEAYSASSHDYGIILSDGSSDLIIMDEATGEFIDTFNILAGNRLKISSFTDGTIFTLTQEYYGN